MQFFPERECIGNYTPNSWVVLTIYNFNTLLLYKEKNDIDSVLQDLFTLSEKGEQVDVYFSRISSCRSGSAVSCVWLAHGVWSGRPTGSPQLPPFQGFVHNIDVGIRLSSTTRMWYKFNFLQICMFLVPLLLVPVLTSPYARVSNNFLIKNVRSNGIFQVNYTAGMVQRVSPSKSPRGSLYRQVHPLLDSISCEVVRGILLL